MFRILVGDYGNPPKNAVTFGGPIVIAVDPSIKLDKFNQKKLGDEYLELKNITKILVINEENIGNNEWIKILLKVTSEKDILFAVETKVGNCFIAQADKKTFKIICEKSSYQNSNEEKNNTLESFNIKEPKDFNKDGKLIEEYELKVKKNKEIKGCFGCTGIFFLLALIGSISMNLNPTGNGKAETEFDQISAKIWCAFEIKDQLNDPSSYKFSSARILRQYGDKKQYGEALIIFRAKNAFGTLIRSKAKCTAYDINGSLEHKAIILE